MMNRNVHQITYTLVTDGSSDECLRHVIDWVIWDVFPAQDIELDSNVADFRKDPSPPKSLSERVKRAVTYFPCDVLFVHRDAESESRRKRIDEITNAVRETTPTPRGVPVVPVRMTEAWLLISEAAIRRAAGNPNGSASITLPSIRRLESVPDPKDILRQLLITASQLKGRKKARFQRDLSKCVHRVAALIEDFSQLRALPAFRAFEEDTREAIGKMLTQSD